MKTTYRAFISQHRVWIALFTFSFALSLIIGIGLSNDANNPIAKITKPLTEEEKAEREEIQETFTAFVTAIRSDDAVAASYIVSPDTLKYYAKIRDLALYGTPEELVQQSLIDQITTLYMRKKAEAHRMCGATAGDAVAFAISNNMINFNLQKFDILKNMEVNGNEAYGDIITSNGEFVIRVRLTKQPPEPGGWPGEWRYDIQPHFARSLRGLKSLAKQNKKSAVQLAFESLEVRLMQKVTPALFEPPFQRNPNHSIGAILETAEAGGCTQDAPDEAKESVSMVKKQEAIK